MTSSTRAQAATLLTMAATLVALTAEPAFAASSRGCEGGGFALTRVLPTGGQVAPVTGPFDDDVPAASLGTSFRAQGRYVGFTVEARSFAVSDWTLTGAPNPLDITGGTPTEVFASKTPDHRGLALDGDVAVSLDGPDLVIERTGPGIAMKVQAKDCAQGGVFQMEVERDDATRTLFTHVLDDDVFYFDNPFFRDRIGQVLNTVPVTARVNFANDTSPAFVGRDSPQVATRIGQGCPSLLFALDHCGGISQWNVASGGRMGQVMGEDAVEVAPPATSCLQRCQAQNRVRGRFVVLGFPFPVPPDSRLAPRTPAT